MIVRVQKPIEFINKCDCIVDYSDLEKAILWYTNKPVTRLKTIYLHGQYPAYKNMNRNKYLPLDNLTLALR